MHTISIIGTAGRGQGNEDALKAFHFEYMCERVQNIIENELALQWKDVHLVSGGAAWADHVAVYTFLKHPESALTLYLPCKLITKNGKVEYIDTGVKDFRTNPGRTSNLYHQRFSKELGRDTLAEIIEAQKQGAKIDSTHFGFHKRNTAVSKSDTLIACTWSDGDKPTTGGTLDTWTKSNSKQRFHISLTEFARSLTDKKTEGNVNSKEESDA